MCLGDVCAYYVLRRREVTDKRSRHGKTHLESQSKQNRLHFVCDFKTPADQNRDVVNGQHHGSGADQPQVKSTKTEDEVIDGCLSS